MGAMSLPPGFRFHPTDDELVGYYLKKKVDGIKIELEVIPVIDLYKFDPWELPDKSFLPKRDMEWFFFCPRDKKYPNGSRTNRATASGYWKATGKDRKVVCEPSVMGQRKTLVFYRGRAPAGDRTDWVMHEYRLCEELPHGSSTFVGAYALCRVIKRNEQGQKASDFMGESTKSKRMAYSASNSLSPVRIPSELLGVHGTQGSISSITTNGSTTPTTSPSDNQSGTESEPIVIDNDQSSQRQSYDHLSDASKTFPFGRGIQSELSPQTLLANSMIGSSPYNSVDTSVMLPNTNLTDDNSSVTGCLMPCLSSSNFMEICSDEGSIGCPGLECGNFSRNMAPSINEYEAWNAMMLSPICRQTSGDSILELSNFWPPEEPMRVW